MADITATDIPAVPRRQRPAAEPLLWPDPIPDRGPIFISDCVIPWRGETLLLTLLRRMVERDIAARQDQSGS